ncbi:ABC transporter permease [Clostridium cylindrosporum]|uniref:Macrolide export ATP-binding/permease protein MacB n=1 Tax=Clostridium cylindrosporum DSM 605 TaxID=1121307 RepID=A0A0J8DAI8_CLOCY|nr:ABC transporter permease [Clostridium cylindrosporum]KMT22862.1 macrolide export ATP-binding/permease protein MacB [Clostridium cylindrosporum DSM 605]
MNFLECFKGAIKNVRSNKMRSFLTMLGIIIGISSVITIVSIGQGGHDFISKEFEGIGSNALSISVKSKAGEVLDRYYFHKEDVNMLINKVPEVIDVAPILQGYGAVVYKNKSKEVTILSTAPSYRNIINANVLEGRFLSDSDVEAARNVVIIDDIAGKKLYPRESPIGQKLTIRTSAKASSYTIVGMIKNPNPTLAYEFSEDFPGMIFIPYTTSEKILRTPNISTMVATVSDMNRSKEISRKIVHILDNKYRAHDRYTVEEAFKQVDLVNKVLSMFTLVIGTIAGISLVVGGIGVMNIMLVSVTERTREIGIRKALGAKKKDIMLQFLTESLIICLIGGTLGMLIGISFSMAIGSLVGVMPSVSISIVILAFAFSSAIGIFFGIYPAKKAAELNPIDALRYE